MVQHLKRGVWVWVVVWMGAQCAFAAAATNTVTVSQAGVLLKQAYLAVVDAEMARSENRNADAASAYRASLVLYGRLQAEYPGWQAATVSYRVAECRNELADLESPKTNGNGTNATPVATASGSGTNTVTRLQSLLVELRDAQAALLSLKDNPADARVKDLTEEAERLRGELDDALRANKILSRRLTQVDAKLKRSGLSDSTNALSKAVSGVIKTEAKRLMGTGNPAAAISLLQESSELMPGDSSLVVMSAVAYCRAGDFGEAIGLLKPFDLWHPTNADALLTLGTAYMGLGQIGNARVATEKAIRLAPESAEAHYNLAQILLAVNPPDLAKVQENYRRAVELGITADPEFENALRTASIINRLKKHKSAGGGGASSASRTIGKPVTIPTTGN